MCGVRDERNVTGKAIYFRSLLLRGAYKMLRTIEFLLQIGLDIWMFVLNL